MVLRGIRNMKTGTFITEIDAEGKINIPSEINDRLQLADGDKVEILLKKIRSKRLDVSISKNPLNKILKLSESTEI
jgi:AbrB family looped-hinge helix DNA binding protein